MIKCSRLFLCLLAVAFTATLAKAHNLDTRATSISLSKDYVQTMTQRAQLGQPAVQLGDEFWVLLKTTPGPGTNTGVGGYQTYYIPQGSQVIGAAYVRPMTSDPRGFIEIPMKAQSPIAIGDGPIGAKAAVGLTGFTYPSANILGVNQAPVTAAGIARGTIAGVYADTGIFYSTDPRTAFNTYGAAPTGGTAPMKNNSGDTVGEWLSAGSTTPDILGVMTLWDSYQLRAFGRSDVAPIIDAADGRGNTPWGMGSAVAGPQSGYKWSYNHAAYVSGGSSAAAIPGAIEAGPWNRIKYPGAQISSDQAGLVSTTVGYTGVDASNVGYDFGVSGPLPTNTTAVRIAIGQLELGRTEYSAVKIKITTLPATQCYDMYADAFGGDAGGTDNGKDHLWRYFDPTVVSLDPCSLLQKVASNPLIAVGGTTSFNITYANLDDTDKPNVVLTDTLPAGLSYLSATPAPTSVSGNVLTWNLGTVPGQSVRNITLNVTGTATGIQLNSLAATSNGTNIGYAYDTVEVASHSLLRKEKTVTPSSAAPGSDVTYTITVYNDGTAANGVPLTITDILPSGFTYQSFASATINGATFTPTINSADLTKPVFTVGQGIAPGKTLVIRFLARIGAGTPSGVYWNGTDLLYEGKRLGPTPEAPVTVGGSRIGDFVWRDWDGDGVQDAGEEGISAISVQLWSDPNGDGNTADGVLLQTTTTDSNGQYLFSGLAAGNYVVKIPTPPSGYLQTFDPQGVVDNAGKVTLTANQEFLTMDFGYKYDPTNINAASIGDFVFADNNRNGLQDTSEAGIPSVSVNLYEDTNGNGLVDAGDLLVGTRPTSDGTTDYNGDSELDPVGFYLFTGLDPALKYVVDVVETDPDIAAFFGLPVSQTTPDRVAVSGMVAGDVFDTADFGFYGLQPASVGDTVFLDTNANGIYDTGDFPISNVTVQLYLDANGDGIAQVGELFSTTSTDSAGQYLFGNLGPDNYIVKVLSGDPDLPSGSISTVSQYPVTLSPGDNITTADFPYVKNLTKTVDKSSALAGEILTYTMRPYYPGSSLLTNAVVTDPTPTGTTYNGGSSPSPFSAPAIGATGNVVWNLGSTVASANGAGSTPGYTPTAIVRSSTAEADDTYVNSGATTTWYGGGTDLVARASAANNTKRPLMKFTLPTFGANDVIDRAVVRVRVKTAATGHNLTMRHLLTAWNEGTAATDGAVWTKPTGTTPATTWAAGGFSASDFDSTVSYGNFTSFIAGRTLEFDVTDLVRAWRAGTVANNGVTLVDSGTAASDLIFYSSENTGVINLGPRLVIGYSVQPNASNVTVADTFSAQNYVNNNGTRTWAGGWVESGEYDGPTAGKWLITTGGRLRIGDNINGASLYRSANLSGAISATLQLDMPTNGLNSTSDVIRLEASKDGGLNWVTLENYTFGSATYTNRQFNLISLLGGVSKDTRIRFRQISKNGGNKNLEFDNLSITYSTPSNGTTTTSMSADTALLTGTRNVTVSMRVSADSATVVTPPTNLTTALTGGATATKLSGPTPSSASADASGATFTWVYSVSAGSTVGSVRFSGTPTGTGGSTFGVANSQSVLVTPPLIYQAKINPVAPNPSVSNTATITDSGGLNVSATAITATIASIGDLVWKDTNSDGLFDLDGADNILGTADDEPGITGVRVYLDSNNNGVYDIGEPNALTDTSGIYRIYGLSAGNYTVRYDSSTIPAGFLPSTATSQAVTLATAEQYNNADFGLSPSSPTPASIGDTLWIDRDGDGVVDSGEPPLPNIAVRLYFDANNNGVIDAGDLLLATTSTDSSGNYSFGGLSAGNYLVDVDEADPQFPAALTLVSGGANGAGLQDVTLTTGANYLTADFGYNYTGSIGDTVFYDPNESGFQDPGELGVAGVTIVLYNDVDNDGSVSAADTVVGTAFTDASGHYLFSNLPPGEYVVKVDEQTVQSTPTSGIYSTMLATTGSSKAVTLSPGSMTELNADFGFIEAAEIKGHVFHDINGNGVLDPDERPLQPVTVWVYGPGVDGILGNADDLADLRKTLVTDIDGEYSTLLPPGGYRVIYDITDPQAEAGILTRVTTPLEYLVYLSAGQEVSGLDFGRDNNGKIGDTIFADIDGTSGAGVGPGAGDARLPGVTVNLYLDTNGNGIIDADGADNIFGTADDEPLLETQATDSTGTYLFQGLSDTTASQKYLVAVDTTTLPSSYQTTATSYPTGAVTATSRYSTTLTGGGTISIVDFGYPPQPSLFTVSGNIWNDSGAGGGAAGDGTKNGTEPNLAGITVTITVNGTPYSVVTDSNGNYSLSGVPGTAAVVITVDSSTLPSNAFGNTGDPDGVKNGTTSFTMTNANKTNQNFGYREVLASVSGTVVRNADGDGLAELGETAVSGVAISLRYAGADGILGTGDDVLLSMSTDTNGDYSFTGLKPGLYEVTETNPTGYFGQADRDGGNPNNIQLIIAAGNPLTGVADNKVDQDFEITHASLGDYVWYDVNGDGVQNVGEPALANVRVFVDSNGNGSFDLGEPSAITNASGAYTIADLAPGTATVRVDSSTLPVGLSPSYDLDGTGTANSASVTLAANQDRTDLDWGFTGNATVTGHLYVDTNGNGIQDSGEQDLTNVNIAIIDSLGFMRTIVTNASGNWTLVVPAGDTTANVDESDPDFTALVLSGYVQTEGNDPTTVTAVAGISTSGGTDGYFNPATIGDFVFNDTNANGQQDGGEAGLAGVTVTLYRPGFGPDGIAGNGDDATAVAAQTTLTGGAYSFSGLPPGNYQVGFGSLSGYNRTLADQGGDATDSDANVTTGLTATYALAAGAINNTIDVGYYQPGSISGTVLADTDGDDDGDVPLKDVVLRLLDGLGNPVLDGLDQPVTTTTDDNGDYSFTSLTPGNYRVVQDQPADYASVSDTDGPNDNVIGNFTPIAVNAGNNNGGNDFIEIKLGVISGYVQRDIDNNGSGDEALQGVLLNLLDGSGNPVLDGFGDPIRVASDTNGYYSFTLVPTGVYQVFQTQPPGYVSVSDVDGANNNTIGDETPIVMTPGLVVTGRNFVEMAYGYIAGNVFADTDFDGNANEDAGIGSVILRLLDAAGDPVLDTNGDPVTTVTDIWGQYSFGDVVPGDYRIAQDQPVGWASVGDTDGANNNLIGDETPVTVLPATVNGGNDFTEIELGSISGYVRVGADPLAGVTLTLLDKNGHPVDGDLNSLGIQPLTTVTDVNGYYVFNNVPAGSYQIAQTQPFGYTSYGDADGGDFDIVGDVTPIVILPGQASEQNNFIETVDTCPDNWDEWKFQHPGETAGGNPDGDAYDNFAEFAFAMPYDSGTGSPWLGNTAWVIQPSALNSEIIDGIFVRPKGALLNVIYTLQYAAAPGNPTVWQSKAIIPDMITTVDNGDCTETVTIHDLETLTGLTGGKGVVRIQADLDDNGGGDGDVDHTSHTEAEGWTATGLEICCRTYNNPYQHETSFTGMVTAVSGQNLSFAATDNLNGLLSSGGTYYIEVTSGDNKGQRFDIVSTGGSIVTLANDSDLHSATAPFNTLTGPPPTNLVGDLVAIHRHRTLDETFPPTGFGASDSQSTADQVQIFAGGAWTIYWLYDENDADLVPSRWVDAANSGMPDMGGTVIPPGQGVFLNNRTGVVSLLAYGEIRANKFIRPLASGRSLVSGGYPIDQSANGIGGRAMSLATGFFGSRDFKTADSFFVWKADTTIGAAGYDTYFLLGGVPSQPTLTKWVKVGDASILSRDAEVLLLGNRSVFIRTANGINGYSVPTPWAP